MNTKPIDQIMSKEMSRKEFMAIVGLGVGSVAGFSTIIKLMTGKSFDSHISKYTGTATAVSDGYSSGVYGGGATKKKF